MQFILDSSRIGQLKNLLIDIYEIAWHYTAFVAQQSTVLVLKLQNTLDMNLTAKVQLIIYYN